MKLIVEGLPRWVTSEHLCSLFQTYGSVRFVSVIFERESRHTGFGCVEMSSMREAEEALTALNNREIKGTVLRVKPSGR
jgi:RNA recognition motif-containing protein